MRDDIFLSFFIDDLKKIICLEKLFYAVEPYIRIKINKLSNILSCSNTQVTIYL